MRRQPIRSGAQRVETIGRPVKIIRPFNHPRADRILLNVSQAGEPIPLVVNQQVAIPAVPQGADALVSAIEIPDVTAAKLFHRRWQADRIGRRHEHVIVRVHQRVSMHAQTMSSNRATQQRDEDCAVGVVADDRAAIVAAVNDVHAHVRNENSWFSRHCSLPSLDSKIRSRKKGQGNAVFRSPLASSCVLSWNRPRLKLPGRRRQGVGHPSDPASGQCGGQTGVRPLGRAGSAGPTPVSRRPRVRRYNGRMVYIFGKDT